jgi:hypothetical protein
MGIGRNRETDRALRSPCEQCGAVAMVRSPTIQRNQQPPCQNRCRLALLDILPSRTTARIATSSNRPEIYGCANKNKTSRRPRIGLGARANICNSCSRHLQIFPKSSQVGACQSVPECADRLPPIPTKTVASGTSSTVRRSIIFSGQLALRVRYTFAAAGCVGAARATMLLVHEETLHVGDR